MLYHVVRRPINQDPTGNSTKSPKQSRRSGSLPPLKLMPRYHYSRLGSNSATNNTEDSLSQNHLDDQTTKATMTATTNNNNNSNPYGPYKSTFIPLVTNNRMMSSNKREFIQIPVTREDGTTVTTNNNARSIPITYVEETTTLLSPLSNNKNDNTTAKPSFTNILRPNSKYFQRHLSNSKEDQITSNGTLSTVPRLPSVSRRLSLTIPVMTTAVTTNTDDNETSKQTIPLSSTRQIPIRLSQATTTASIPTNSSRISSAILQPSTISNTLQRQKTDIGEISSSILSSSPPINNLQQTSSDPTSPSTSITPIRRAEAMAREAIQGIARLQQQRSNSMSENTTNRSPTLSRRIIINLKNNQSVSLDSHLSPSLKPPPGPSTSRAVSRNNVYQIPILHEIQIPTYPLIRSSETSSQISSTTNSSANNNNYKNEFHLEIPVTITTSNDQENQNELTNAKETGKMNREQNPSTTTGTTNNPNQTLKSILKRSSSRETVSRKNVSFMNA